MPRTRSRRRHAAVDALAPPRTAMSPAGFPGRNRLSPLVATAVLIVFGMVTSTWGAHLIGQAGWALPHDLWRTLVAADRLRHLELGGLYTQPTALVTFPGAALILVPVVAVIDAAGLGLAFQTAQNPFPSAWLVAGPYQIAISGSALFAADAIAERLGADRRSRAVLAAAGVVALWNVSVRFGHPEDAVALAFLLYAILAMANARPARAAWLVGVAVAVQPLVLLGLPIVLAALPAGRGVRRIVGFLVRAAVPGVGLLGAAALANWEATVRAVAHQPNFPTSSSNHSTPWTLLAPEMGGGAVSAGPGRILAILLACGLGVVIGRRWRGIGQSRSGRWRPARLAEVLWWVALALAGRCLFESVMVSFYTWPVLAVALVAAARWWGGLLVTAVLTGVVTVVSQASWPGPWLWWTVMVFGLGLTLFAARGRPASKAPDDAALHE
ncbi:hypothetical protein ABIB25_002975 [Nakamurella sp. UYEF19]|uniref:hypothetical protein n=1 Tax=Nakamurella sp. UYEF19 TaxID=1756392 RepID=UPI00339847DE